MSTPARLPPRPRLGMTHEARLSFDRASSSLDVWLTALPFAAILFNRWLGALTPILILAVTPAFVVLRRERLYHVLSGTWPLLLLPLLCLLSVFWSQAPADTLRYGFFFLLTVIPAIFVGAGLNRDAVLKGILAAFASYMICSVLFGRWVAWADGGLAFAGLAGSKNAAGDAAALSVLVAFAGLLWALHRRNLAWGLVAVVTLPLGLYCLVTSKATGVMIATGVALPCMAAWFVSRRLELSVRTAILLVIGIAMIGLLSTIRMWMPPLFDLVLESSGKDAGLTGRLILWQKADELIAQRPWFGSGYNAFWTTHNLDAEYLWRTMGIPQGNVFNFHNTAREILVDLGYVGLAVFGSVAAVACLRLMWKVMVDPNHLGIFCCTVVVFQVPRFQFEVIGFSNMHFATLLIFTVLAYGFRRKDLQAVAGN